MIQTKRPNIRKLAPQPFVVQKISKPKGYKQARIDLIENFKTGCGTAVSLFVPKGQDTEFSVGQAITGYFTQPGCSAQPLLAVQTGSNQVFWQYEGVDPEELYPY